MKKLALFLLILSLPICASAVEMNEHQLAELKHLAATEFQHLERQHLHRQTRAEKYQSRPASTASNDPIRSPGGNQPAVLVEQIRQIEDVALREAMLDYWLSEQQQKPAQSRQELEALQSLTNETRHVRIPHHDMPHHTIPAFNVAQRATNLLVFRQRQARAQSMVNDFDRLLSAFQAEPGSEAFQTAALASQSLDRQHKQQLRNHFQNQLPSRPLAARPLLELVQSASDDPALLADVIEYGDQASARQAVRMIDPNPEFQHLAERALARPEIGGLAIQAWINTGGEVDQHLWPLLADPDLGADAARALADGSTRLVETIEAEIDTATTAARLRMLLALKLRNNQASRSLLQQLISAEWLTEQQREEIALWL